MAKKTMKKLDYIVRLLVFIIASPFFTTIWLLAFLESPSGACSAMKPFLRDWFMAKNL